MVRVTGRRTSRPAVSPQLERLRLVVRDAQEIAHRDVHVDHMHAPFGGEVAGDIEVGTAEPVRGIRVRRAHVARIRVWRSTPGMGARERAEEPGEEDGGEAESSHGLSPIAET